MNKVAHYLQEHLLGEVTDHPDVRRHFAEDASLLGQEPAVVVYPRTEEDIRKTASFSWQLAHRGQKMPITSRGAGSDTSGAATGAGIVLVFPAHMNKILQLVAKKQYVTVEPGVNYDTLEQALGTHGFMLPPYPASRNYATIGGGIANNTLGEKSVKYGAIGDWVRSLRVVLSNGEVIETRPLGKRELSRKMGLSSFEGEIYRSLDKLLEENHQDIEAGRQKFANLYNAAGYNLFQVKHKGSFDLTPLIVGSQGSLGIITEATLDVTAYNPQTLLCLASLPDIAKVDETVKKILKLGPSVFDALNRQAIELISQINPNQLNGILTEPKADLQLIIEFDDFKEADRKKAVKSLRKIIEHLGGNLRVAAEPEEQEKIRKLQSSVASIVNFSRGQLKAVPVAEDVSVPTDRLGEFMSQAYKLFESLDMAPAAWGHIGLGILRFQPMLDLASTGDRQKLFKISDGIYGLAVNLGGTITAGASDGRIRAPYLELQYGQRLKTLMNEVKRIFDPQDILNPGVKSATPDEVKSLMRSDYGPSHHRHHLPRG